VHLEILRGIGLFLSMLIHFDTSVAASVSETLGPDLENCAILLSLYHVLRWSCTRVDPTTRPSLWNAEGSLMSIANIHSPNLDQRMEGISLANSGNVALSHRYSKNSLHNFITSVFGQLCSLDDNANSTELWKDTIFLLGIVEVHEIGRIDKLNPAIAALMHGVCFVRVSDCRAAKICLNGFVDMARNNIQTLQSFVNCAMHQEIEIAPRTFQEDLISAFEEQDGEDEVMPLIHLFFLLHDEKSGIFKFISDSIDRTKLSGSATNFEISSNDLRLIELGSLRKLAAMTTRLRKYTQYQLPMDVLVKLTALAHDRVVANIVSHYCKQNPFSEVAFDIAYSLIADKIKDCRDVDMETLRKQGEDADLRADEVEKIYIWCSAERNGIDFEQERNVVSSLLVKRRRHSSYQLLRCFLTQLHTRRILHRVCSYPWIGCGQTVDSFLKELCDVPGQDQIDAAYRAR
jgi:hypothetical protein